MDKQIREWNELDHNQRNSLMWPDFLKWEEQSRNVEITRTDPNGSLGLVSIDVQDQETKEWYHVTKRIKDDSPAVAHVKPYEWIYKVDNVITNCPCDEFIKLINNGKKVVQLSLKKAHDTLSEFVRQWGEEKTVTLNLKEDNNFKNEFRLAHFYSEGNSNMQDRILVWEVKPDSAETNKPLYRGDELLEVNGETVVGKKLAEIYKLIFDEANAEVKMTFKEIQRKMCNEVENHQNAMRAETETLSQCPDEENKSLELDNPTQCIVVTQEMDKNAGKEDAEVYDNPVVLNEFKNDKSPAPTACTEEQKKPVTQTMTKKLRRFSFKRSLSKDSASSPEQIKEQQTLGKNESDNIGYSATPPPSRKSSMCSPCVMKKESDSEISENRDTWPISMIDPGTFEDICRLIDLEDSNTIPLFTALDCFIQIEVENMRSQCKATGGVGIAKKALSKWGTNRRENNVGAFKEIVEKSLQRDDVLKKIRAWEKMSVCHSCGRKK